jgi:hypothetical protein
MRQLLFGLVLIAAGAASTAQAKAVLSPDSWLCAIGQFTSADGKTTVEIDNGAIAVGACPMTPAKLKVGKKRSVLSARWPGCDGFKGAVRVTAKLTPGTCDAVDVRVKAKKLNRRVAAARTKGEAKDCQTGDTFDQIQRRIFGAKGCRVATCHGDAKQGGLDLQVGTAYQSLVSAAVGAPGEQRVQPGSAAKSFLVRKLAGALAPGEGVRMPSVGHPLRPARARPRPRVDRRRRARDRHRRRRAVSGAAQVSGAAPLTTPPGGYQIYYEGPILQPGEEIEGCEWIEAPNDKDFASGPGSTRSTRHASLRALGASPRGRDAGAAHLEQGWRMHPGRRTLRHQPFRLAGSALLRRAVAREHREDREGRLDSSASIRTTSTSSTFRSG